MYEGISQVFVTTNIPFDFIPFTNVLLPVVASFVVAGMFVGFAGSFLSIRKYLKMEGNEILGW